MDKYIFQRYRVYIRPLSKVPILATHLLMYHTIQKLNNEKFRRKTGVKRKTFEVMVNLVRDHEDKRKKLKGRPFKLSYENQVLMTLGYLREYVTYFSLG